MCIRDRTRCAQTCSEKRGFFPAPTHSSKSIPQCFSPQKRCPPPRTSARFHACFGTGFVYMFHYLNSNTIPVIAVYEMLHTKLSYPKNRSGLGQEQPPGERNNKERDRHRLRPGLRTDYGDDGRTSQSLEHCPSRLLASLFRALLIRGFPIIVVIRS